MSMTQFGANAQDSNPSIEIALYQPDIPQNTGNILRLCACLGVRLHIIGPAGFDISDRALRRAALDYGGHADIVRHEAFAAFEAWRRLSGKKLVLVTSRGETSYLQYAFDRSDILLMGRESAGVPEDVQNLADVRLRIPMRPGMRSINIAAAAALVLGEALRQTDGFARLS